MKYVLWAIGVPASLALVFLAVQILASERVEVIDLFTTDELGEMQTTRLWVMDDEGYQYLRVGSDGSGWFDRVLQNGEIKVGRNGTTASYTVVQRADKSERINDMMQEKYTWGDTFFATMLGSRDGSIPLELHPVN
jgi:hypothetical protein